jgi:hypothetical protein
VTRPPSDPPCTSYSYLAEYSDAPNVSGTVDAASIFDAADAAAHDLLTQVGADPVAYGQLVKMTVKANEDGIELAIIPERE